jgi:transcriptional regulator with XRE-family HTH domain
MRQDPSPRAGTNAPADSLAGRLRQHIDAAYGGNQRAFADAVGLTPQHVYGLLSGKIVLPRPAIRRVLARELGMTHPDLLVLIGELAPDEATPQPRVDPPAVADLATIARALDPAAQAALLAIARELQRQRPVPSS